MNQVREKRYLVTHGLRACGHRNDCAHALSLGVRRRDQDGGDRKSQPRDARERTHMAGSATEAEIGGALPYRHREHCDPTPRRSISCRAVDDASEAARTFPKHTWPSATPTPFGCSSEPRAGGGSASIMAWRGVGQGGVVGLGFASREIVSRDTDVFSRNGLAVLRSVTSRLRQRATRRGWFLKNRGLAKRTRGRGAVLQLRSRVWLIARCLRESAVMIRGNRGGSTRSVHPAVVGCSQSVAERRRQR